MIDWQQVATLRTDIGEDEFEEVVPIFLEEVADIIEAVQGDADRSKLEQNLHALKGSALNLGFSEFSLLCSKGERLAQAGQAAEVDVPAILDSFARSKIAFEDGLAELLAA